MIYAKVDRDYIAEDDDVSRVGIEWSSDLFPVGDTVRFRVKDDDGEVYYGGWLINDPYGNVQYNVLKWAEHDAGATTIEVKLNGKWVQEIG